MEIIQAWRDYFGILGPAAATLLGLLFVSVSLNADIILDSTQKHSMRLAEQAFHNYITALSVCLAIFFPGVPNYDRGLVILILSGIYTVWLLIRFFHAVTTPLAIETRLRALRRYSITLLGFIALMIGGYQMLFDEKNHILIAVGSLILLISAIAISWELLIKIAEAKYGAAKRAR